MIKKILLSILIIGNFQIFAQSFSIHLQSGVFTPIETNLSDVRWNNNELVNNYYYRFIQFKTIPTNEEKNLFAQQGILLYNYIPNNTFMAAIPAIFDITQLNGSSIRSVFPLEKNVKLETSLLKKQYPNWALKPNNKIELVAMQHPNIAYEQVSMWLKNEGAEVLHTITRQGAHRIIIKLSDIEKFASLPYLYFLEPIDSDPKPDNLVGRSDHRSNMIATDYTGGLKYDGSGMKIALNDDGVIGPHIDYQGRLINQFIGFNNGNHGDHCAGTIMGAGNRNPVARGMAFGADLGVYGVSGMFSTLYQAFDSIYSHYNKHEIRITSTSYSNGNNAGYTSLAQLMDIHINDMPDLIHVFSAGNAGTSDFGYGAGAGWGNITGGHKQAKNVIATGNVTYQDVLANSSSRGPAHDGRIKPDICAVGTNVLSTIDPHNYASFTGTSMACPGIAGTLGQLYHAYKDLNNGVIPSSALIKACVLNTGDDLGNPGPDYKHGWGRVNARRAYKIISNNQFLSDAISQGGIKTHTINVPNGVSELRVMTYWHDYQATVGTSKALVNNLDFTLTTPSSQVVLPWVLDPTPNVVNLNANALQKVDTLNNVEQVTIPTPVSGNYTVTITGTQIPQGPQEYYVVYEFVTNEITLTYPSGGESIVPGTQETIRWDAYGNSGTFSLEYSSDNGNSWNTIAAGIAATQRYYDWNPPTIVTGQALVRVTRGAINDISDAPFSIIGVPANLTVDWVCIDSMQVSYSAVTGASGYIVSILGNKYMDSVGFSTTTTCVVKNINTFNPGWFSVHAIAPNKCVGRRAIAQQYQAVPFNCVITDDIVMINNLAPNGTSILNCQPIANPFSVSITIKNAGLTPASNITVKYTVNGGSPVTENYAGPLNANTVTVYNFVQGLTLSSPGNHEIKAWIEHPNNQISINDTTTWFKNVVAQPVLPLPLFEDFETFSLCGTTTNCATEVCTMTNGWLNEFNNLGDSIDWRTNSGPTPTTNSGPAMDFLPGTLDGKYVYIEASACFNKPAELISPCIEIANNLIAPEMSFAYHMWGADMGELHVDIFSDSAWINDVIPALSGDKGNNWNNAIVPLNSYIGKTINIRFRGISGTNFNSDMALDAISITDPVGLNEQEPEMVMQLFPNPTNGLVNVIMYRVFSDTEISVTDLNGKIIFNNVFTPNGNTINTSIDLSHIDAGLYFISVKNNKGVINRKLLKF